VGRKAALLLFQDTYRAGSIFPVHGQVYVEVGSGGGRGGLVQQRSRAFRVWRLSQNAKCVGCEGLLIASRFFGKAGPDGLKRRV
jgi:hypothetical protein